MSITQLTPHKNTFKQQLNLLCSMETKRNGTFFYWAFITVPSKALYAIAAFTLQLFAMAMAQFQFKIVSRNFHRFGLLD